MIWADRVGLGIVAILGMLVAYLTIDNRSQIRAVQANYAHEVAVCEEPARARAARPPPTADDLISEWPDYNPSCNKLKPPKIDPYDPMEALLGLWLFVALPLWLVLRILDFMFGGPPRRAIS